jgi:hypothetical protein
MKTILKKATDYVQASRLHIIGGFSCQSFTLKRYDFLSQRR